MGGKSSRSNQFSKLRAKISVLVKNKWLQYGGQKAYQQKASGTERRPVTFGLFVANERVVFIGSCSLTCTDVEMEHG